MFLNEYLIKKSDCSFSEKNSCIPIIEELLNWYLKYRKEGLFVFEPFLKEDHSEQKYVFDDIYLFENGLPLFVNGFDKHLIINYCQNVLYTIDKKGVNFLKELIVAQWLYLLNDTPHISIVKKLLLSLLGSQFYDYQIDIKKYEYTASDYSNNESLDEKKYSTTEKVNILSSEEIDALLQEINKDRKIMIDEIEKILIHSEILTFKGSKSELRIEKKDDVFLLYFEQYAGYNSDIFELILDGVLVDSDLICDFVQAVNEKPLNNIDFESFYLNEAFFRENATNLILKYNKESIFNEIPQEKIEAAVKMLYNTDLVKQLVFHHYSSYWTDDYPYIKIEIIYKNGYSTIVESKSQHYYMIPWIINNLDEKNFNLNISRTLNKIIPDQFVNKKRISGDYLIFDIITNIKERIDFLN
ncbi:MAG: hypothetical protein A2086_07175 [Spirochaetes bacterium GWD1_27_9]|nr:MAG: hypothetical protein A2Y34_09230 [Spirochaetes bacterium GWC1_27_15]OHD29138.1 MAG: hypothetical protein A2086_07175 [Spirochaetes bacterium GWD1_27_9]